MRDYCFYAVLRLCLMPKLRLRISAGWRAARRARYAERLPLSFDDNFLAGLEHSRATLFSIFEAEAPRDLRGGFHDAGAEYRRHVDFATKCRHMRSFVRRRLSISRGMP